MQVVPNKIAAGLGSCPTSHCLSIITKLSDMTSACIHIKINETLRMPALLHNNICNSDSTNSNFRCDLISCAFSSRPVCFEHKVICTILLQMIAQVLVAKVLSFANVLHAHTSLKKGHQLHGQDCCTLEPNALKKACSAYQWKNCQ